MNNDILLAIPARAGSKRLSQKNIKYLNGKPMLAYTIEAALASELSPHVYVCTEDETIAGIAETYGAKVHAISAEMAGDEVSSTVPCLDLYNYLSNKHQAIATIINLQPSSPLRDSDDIKSAYQLFINSAADSLVSATFIDPHYFHWALQQQHKTWQMYFGQQYLKERTQLPPVYRPNGAIKMAKSEVLLKVGNVFTENMHVYTMPEERSIHVATEFDFRCAQAMLS